MRGMSGREPRGEYFNYLIRLGDSDGVGADWDVQARCMMIIRSLAYGREKVSNNDDAVP